MGGSGAPRRYRGGGDADDTCELIRFDTVLLSPSVTLLAEVRVGTVLRVAINPDGGAGTVGVFNADNALLGSVSHLSVGKLLLCMRDGHEYVADVLKIEGAECRIKIHHTRH